MPVKFHQDTAEIFVPDGLPESDALARVTHLAVGAHHDDLEFMAFHGILSCFDRTDQWFGGVTCTNGSGSARTGAYAAYTDEQMIAVRRQEQREAARLGQYAFVGQLAYPSTSVKQTDDGRLADDLLALLTATRPEVVYTHNPADKHETHIAVTLAVLDALRRLPPETRPARVLGCEMWRDLDWLDAADKVVLDVGGHDDLADRLHRVFASQIEGGKRYDLAVEGRKRANATFLESHHTDVMEKVWFAMDLTPLIKDDRLNPAAFVLEKIDRFRSDVERALMGPTKS